MIVRNQFKTIPPFVKLNNNMHSVHITPCRSNQLIKSNKSSLDVEQGFEKLRIICMKYEENCNYHRSTIFLHPISGIIFEANYVAFQ